MQRVRIVLLGGSLLGGCVKQLPPAPMPAPIVPTVQASPAPPGGHGRLFLDVVEGPAPIQRIQMQSRQQQNAQGRPSFRFFEVPEVLCATSPCVVDVPVGNVLLGFPVIGKSNAREVELVHVGPDPSVYRRSLSIYEDTSGGVRVMGIIATSVGGAALMTGAALLPIGLARDSTGMTVAGGLSLGVGTVLLTLGILAMRADSPTFRPGASNHFPLAPSP